MELPLLHPFNGLFSRTIRIRQKQKGKTSLDLNEARDDVVLGWWWHQLQTLCILLQTDIHTNTSSLIFTGLMLFLMPKALKVKLHGTLTEIQANKM